jgi:hypothetical protein
MPVADIIDAKTMSSRWRMFCLLIIASLQVALVCRAATHIIPERNWWLTLLSVLFTATLIATGYDIAVKGRPTRLAFCFWLPPFICAFAYDIVRAWNHDPNMDPFFRLLVDACYVFMVLTWILTDPFGPKKGVPVIIKKTFT